MDWTNFEHLKNFISEEDVERINQLDLAKLDTLLSKRQIWLKEKKGKFSASNFCKLMAYEDKNELSKGALTYINKLVLETETEQSDDDKPRIRQMEHGKKYEKEAVEEFVRITGTKVDKYGEDQEFIQLDDNTGCTPDGLIDNDGGIETKCPDSETHYFNLRYLTAENFKENYIDYYWQVQGSMYVTGRKYWYFVSYDPRFKNEAKRLHIIKIYRDDEDIEKLRRRLFMATRQKNKQIKELNN